MRLNILGLVVGVILALLLIAWGMVSAQDEPEVANGWGCTYLPVIFGTLPDDTTELLPGEPAIIPVTGLALCRSVNIGDPQQPTPEATATSTVAPTPEATATVEPTATATIEPTATVGVTETVTPEATATCDPDDDDDDSIGTMGGGHDDNDCDDDD